MITDRPVSRSDIEAKLREIQGEASSTGESVRSLALIGGAVATVAVVGVAFWLGKRRGKRKRTIVEVRRV
jgi:LPXTG-motif cell wall-anchored protein